MTQGGFLDVKPRSPVGAGVVVALHGAALAALILFPPEFVRTPTVFTEIFDVPLPKEPEPLPPPEPRKDEAQQPSVVDRPTPRVPTATDGPVIAIPDALPLPPMPPLPPVPVPKIEPALPPAPVIVTASLDPRHADALQPPYPAAMERAEIAGVVVVRVLIGADGRVKAVEQVSADDPAFFVATERQALRRWRFRPAMRDGVAVESWKEMRVRFELPG